MQAEILRPMYIVMSYSTKESLARLPALRAFRVATRNQTQTLNPLDASLLKEVKVRCYLLEHELYQMPAGARVPLTIRFTGRKVGPEPDGGGKFTRQADELLGRFAQYFKENFRARSDRRAKTS
jgi:hypothetical protein